MSRATREVTIYERRLRWGTGRRAGLVVHGLTAFRVDGVAWWVAVRVVPVDGTGRAVGSPYLAGGAEASELGGSEVRLGEEVAALPRAAARALREWRRTLPATRVRRGGVLGPTTRGRGTRLANQDG